MALQAAKPLLLLPEHIEQGILANRLARQGLAGATVRLRDRQNMLRRVESLLAGGNLPQAVSEFAARHAAFSPSHAVDRLLLKLLPDDLQSVHLTQPNG